MSTEHCCICLCRFRFDDVIGIFNRQIVHARCLPKAPPLTDPKLEEDRR